MLFSELKENPNKIYEVKVREYLPIMLKNTLIFGEKDENFDIDGVLDACIFEKDELFFVDHIKKELALFTAILFFYTDIEIDKNISIIEVYDFMKSNRMYKVITDKLDSDLDLFTLIDKQIEDSITQLNSVKFALMKIVNNFINKIPDIEKVIKDFPKMIKKIDKSQLEMFANLIPKGIVNN